MERGAERADRRKKSIPEGKPRGGAAKSTPKKREGKRGGNDAGGATTLALRAKWT